MTRSVAAELSEEDLCRLDERARRAGIDRARCAGQLISKALDTPNETPAAATLREIVAPIQRGFTESGMTDEESYRFLEDQLEESRREKKAKRA